MLIEHARADVHQRTHSSDHFLLLIVIIILLVCCTIPHVTCHHSQLPRGSRPQVAFCLTNNVTHTPPCPRQIEPISDYNAHRSTLKKPQLIFCLAPTTLTAKIYAEVERIHVLHCTTLGLIARQDVI